MPCSFLSLDLLRQSCVLEESPSCCSLCVVLACLVRAVLATVYYRSLGLCFFSAPVFPSLHRSISVSLSVSLYFALCLSLPLCLSACCPLSLSLFLLAFPSFLFPFLTSSPRFSLSLSDLFVHHRAHLVCLKSTISQDCLVTSLKKAMLAMALRRTGAVLLPFGARSVTTGKGLRTTWMMSLMQRFSRTSLLSEKTKLEVRYNREDTIDGVGEAGNDRIKMRVRRKKLFLIHPDMVTHTITNCPYTLVFVFCLKRSRLCFISAAKYDMPA